MSTAFNPAQQQFDRDYAVVRTDVMKGLMTKAAAKEWLRLRAAQVVVEIGKGIARDVATNIYGKRADRELDWIKEIKGEEEDE